MKLNRKGYMLVEIIISFTLAMGIAYYLLNLTYKFKNMDEDIYMSTVFIKDKTAITKNIMNDIDRGLVSNINKVDDNTIVFRLHLNNENLSESEGRKLHIDKENKTIEYGKLTDDGTNFDKDDVSYYYKEIDASLNIKNCVIEESPVANYGYIIINISSLYDDNDYNIKIFAQKGNIT